MVNSYLNIEAYFATSSYLEDNNISITSAPCNSMNAVRNLFFYFPNIYSPFRNTFIRISSPFF